MPTPPATPARAETHRERIGAAARLEAACHRLSDSDLACDLRLALSEGLSRFAGYVPLRWGVLQRAGLWNACRKRVA